MIKYTSRFKIDVSELYWLNREADSPGDLCLHGHAIVYIGDIRLEDDCTVSATALYLLKSLTEDHIINEDNQMLPCCGHSYFPDRKNENNVIISGCPYGTDWTIKHSCNEVVLILENGTEERIPIDEYKAEVFRFADKIEAYYNKCQPKQLQDYDEFDRKMYRLFWDEWHRRRL